MGKGISGIILLLVIVVYFQNCAEKGLVMNSETLAAHGEKVFEPGSHSIIIPEGVTQIEVTGSGGGGGGGACGDFGANGKGIGGNGAPGFLLIKW